MVLKEKINNDFLSLKWKAPRIKGKKTMVNILFKTSFRFLTIYLESVLFSYAKTYNK